MKKNLFNAPRGLIWGMVMIAAAILLTAVPVAAQTEVYNETFEDYDTSSIICYRAGGSGDDYWYPGNTIVVTDTIAQLEISQIIIQGPEAGSLRPPPGAPDSGGWPITLTVGDNIIGYGEYYYFKYYVGDTVYYQAVIDLEEFDPPASTGNIAMSSAPIGYDYLRYNHGGMGTYPPAYFLDMISTNKAGYKIYVWDGGHGISIDPNVKITSIERHNWMNRLTIIDTMGPNNITTVSLIRDTPLGVLNRSTIYITDKSGTIYNSADSYSNAKFWILGQNYPLDVSIDNYLGKTFNRTISITGIDDPGAPGEPAPVTVYVRNSQTGAAIANSRCVIEALVGGDYYPVVNRTEPSGIFSVTLQTTGGGLPNPDSYRLIATADGYNNPMPEINFTVDEYTTSVYCYLDPIAGGPLDENKTFIDFFVRDLTANPISGATVNFGRYTLITNSQGYTVFEMPKNTAYSYTVSKPGYGPLTGNAVIGGEPRYTVNTVLGPAVTPTSPTAIPTATAIHPTPTLTAPTGEHVSNWLEWFAAHFGMILGGGVEIGKIFMWLCFSVPVGVYVGKEAKAGAAGFMAGAGIVTLFFVLIGWVPIWLLVLLALIIGLLYAKVFNNSDTGGGR